MSESAARKLLYRRSERVCERCGMRRAVNAHHRRSAGRVWTSENLLDLDGSGTTGCHGWVTDHKDIAREFGWVVGNRINPLWTPVLIATRHGFRWCYLTRDGQRVPVRNIAGLPSIREGFPDLPAIRA